MHFQNTGAHQNCYLKKYISKHGCTSKLLPQKIHFKVFVIEDFKITWVYARAEF